MHTPRDSERTTGTLASLLLSPVERTQCYIMFWCVLLLLLLLSSLSFQDITEQVGNKAAARIQKGWKEFMLKRKQKRVAQFKQDMTAEYEDTSNDEGETEVEVVKESDKVL